jgi:uncharacterized membrane protein YbhN (UPF0104 family)
MERFVLKARTTLGRRSLVAAAVVSVAALVVATMPQLLGPEVQRALARLHQARPAWVWLAAVSFASTLVFNGWAWRSAVGLCGGKIGRTEAAACYGIGSLVNAAAVARLGDAVRIGLFSRAFSTRERLWTTGGVLTAVGAARALCLALILLAASATGALPFWPVLLLGALVGVAAVVAFSTRNNRAGNRVSHFLDAFRGLARSPAQAARMVGWIVCSVIARLAGVTAVAAAFGVDSPLLAALIIVPALDVAGVLPLTPGNLALGSGTVAVALQSKGISLTTALSVGIGLHAIETACSLVVGLSGVLFLTRFPSPAARLWTVRLAGGTAVVALAALFGATVLIDAV